MNRRQYEAMGEALVAAQDRAEKAEAEVERLKEDLEDQCYVVIAHTCGEALADGKYAGYTPHDFGDGERAMDWLVINGYWEVHPDNRCYARPKGGEG